MDASEESKRMETGQTNLSLERAIDIVRRRAPWIALCVVVVTGAAYGFSKQQAKKYTATATLVFSNNDLGQQIAGLPGTGSNESQQTQQTTNLKLIQLGDVAARTARRLGISSGRVSGSLSVSAQGESNLIDVSATASSPVLAEEIANTYTRQFVAEQRSRNHATYVSALKLVNKQLASLSPRDRAGTAGANLQGRAQSLGVLADLREGNVRIAEAAGTPSGPSSPNVKRNTIFGVVLGLLLGLAVAFLLERLDRRIREPEDLQPIYGVPLLGVIPQSAALSRSAGRRRSPRRKQNAKRGLPFREDEAFQLIRAHLRYFNIDRELRTLLVASAGPGDGKTTVARHLASAAARMGSVVLLLEADLRSPALAGQLNLKPGPGLSDVLIGELSLWSATQLVDVDSPPADGSAGRSLDVLTAGVPLPPNPARLIESRAMEEVLEEARSTYDLVVIDTSPLVVVSDAFPLLRKVDGVIVVAREGRSRRDVAERLRETLMGARAPLLGVIANGFNVPRPRSHDRAYGAADAAGGWTPAQQLSPNGAAASAEPLPQPHDRGAPELEASGSREDGSGGLEHLTK
jgi:capsular exopolysaccharide synthesis family protein